MTQNTAVRYTDFTADSFSDALRQLVADDVSIEAWVAVRGGRRNLGVQDRLFLVAMRTRQIWALLPPDGQPDFITYLVHSVWAWRDKKVSDYLAYRELRRIYSRPAVLHLRAPERDWKPNECFQPPRRQRFKKAAPILVSTYPDQLFTKCGAQI